MADIEKLKALAEAAPKGEWSFDVAIPERGFCAQVWDAGGNDLATLHATHEASAAAQFIAEANPAAILELIAEVERLRHVSAWVSVEERLPESGAPVLVWCDGCGCAGVAWIRQGAWLMPEPQPLGYESITHWMPLPAGPTATESRP